MLVSPYRISEAASVGVAHGISATGKSIGCTVMLLTADWLSLVPSSFRATFASRLGYASRCTLVSVGCFYRLFLA